MLLLLKVVVEVGGYLILFVSKSEYFLRFATLLSVLVDITLFRIFKLLGLELTLFYFYFSPINLLDVFARSGIVPFSTLLFIEEFSLLPKGDGESLLTF